MPIIVKCSDCILRAVVAARRLVNQLGSGDVTIGMVEKKGLRAGSSGEELQLEYSAILWPVIV